MIEIKNLKKSFGDLLIWENVSFNIEDSETIAIIGRSGSGKSVLVKHVNALMCPDEGEVLIEGANVHELQYIRQRKVRQKFGILFQGSALFDSINTFENIAFPLRYFTDKSEGEIRDEVERTLELVKMPGIGEKETSE